jgi:hypothetical protein
MRHPPLSLIGSPALPQRENRTGCAFGRKAAAQYRNVSFRRLKQPDAAIRIVQFQIVVKTFTGKLAKKRIVSQNGAKKPDPRNAGSGSAIEG